MNIQTSLLKILGISLLTLFSLSTALAQQLPSVSQLQSMSSEQLQDYWKKAQEQGYSIEQVEQMARLRGVSEADIQALKQKLQSAGAITTTTKEDQKDAAQTSFGYSTDQNNEFNQFEAEPKKEKSLIFGKDFFQNPKINLEPNLNIAVSNNYQLGPGDEITIDVWGAAQKNYTATVSKQGSIVLENLAPIYINGLTLSKATAKIKSKLAALYAGIGDEVGADVYLNKARTIVVNIIGQVETPGTYSISSLSTAINA